MESPVPRRSGEKSITAAEEAQLEEMLKNPAFREEFMTYASGIKDPQQLAEMEAYLAQLERDGGVPAGKQLVRPSPGFVIEVILAVSRPNSGTPGTHHYTVFVNVVSHGSVVQSSLKKDPQTGRPLFTLPRMVGPLRRAAPPAGSSAAVAQGSHQGGRTADSSKSAGAASPLFACDMCVHPGALQLAERSTQVLQSVCEQAGEAAREALSSRLAGGSSGVEVTVTRVSSLRGISTSAYVGGATGDVPESMLVAATLAAPTTSTANQASPGAIPVAPAAAPVDSAAAAAAAVLKAPRAPPSPQGQKQQTQQQAQQLQRQPAGASAGTAAVPREVPPRQPPLLPRTPSGALVLSPSTRVVTRVHSSVDPRAAGEETMVIRIALPGVSGVRQLEVDLQASVLELSSLEVVIPQPIAAAAAGQAGGDPGAAAGPHVCLTLPHGSEGGVPAAAGSSTPPSAPMLSAVHPGPTPQCCCAGAGQCVAVPIPASGLAVRYSLVLQLPSRVDPDSPATKAQFLLESGELVISAPLSRRPLVPVQEQAPAPAPVAEPVVPAAVPASPSDHTPVASRLNAQPAPSSSTAAQGPAVTLATAAPLAAQAAQGPAATKATAAPLASSASTSTAATHAPTAPQQSALPVNVPARAAAAPAAGEGGFAVPYRCRQSAATVTLIFDVPRVIQGSQRVESAGETVFRVSFTAAGEPASSSAPGSGGPQPSPERRYSCVLKLAGAVRSGQPQWSVTDANVLLSLTKAVQGVWPGEAVLVGAGGKAGAPAAPSPGPGGPSHLHTAANASEPSQPVTAPSHPEAKPAVAEQPVLEANERGVFSI